MNAVQTSLNLVQAIAIIPLMNNVQMECAIATNTAAARSHLAVPGGLGHRLWFGNTLPFLVARLFANRIRVTNGERVPVAGPVLFVALHRAGLVDGWLYAHAIPRPTVFVIAARLRRNWLLRPLVAGIPVMRGKDGDEHRGAANHAGLLACQDELAAGRTVCIFPEGTSSLGPDHLSLEPGAARLARAMPGTAVVPLAIRYANPVAVGTDVEIAVGEPAYLVPGGTAEQAQAQVVAAIESLEPSASGERGPSKGGGASWACVVGFADAPVRWMAQLAGRLLADDDTAVLTWATMIGLPLQLLWSAGLLAWCLAASHTWLAASYAALLAARLLRPTERVRA